MDTDQEPVDVWVADLDRAGLDGSACSHGEHDRAARFRNPATGARWLAAHHLVRALLAARLACRPEAIEFDEGAHGKPSVPGVEFNLAHAGGIAVVAIADRPVGVDVEVRRALARPAGVARRLGIEWSDAAGADELLRAWTRTEALVKATGDGASGGLARAEDRLAPFGWVVVELDLGIAAVGAVAARGRDWTVAGPHRIPPG